MRSILSSMITTTATLALAGGFTAPVYAAGLNDTPSDNLKQIQTVVVIYAENRSFDNLYGHFPGADGLQATATASPVQLDRDGSPLKELPPVWNGLTAKGITPPVTEAETEHLPNQPYYVDDAKGFNLPITTITRDLWHRYYQNQMQIDGGRTTSSPPMPIPARW